MSQTIYLITGANRGIGRGLVTSLLQRPNTTILAAVRDPSHQTAKDLETLSKGLNSNIQIIKIDSASDTDAREALQPFTSLLNTHAHPSHGITHIDVVIANAGIAKYYGTAEETPVEEMREHHQINVIAPLLLFQATLPLLQKSRNPKFVPISSAAGTIGDMEKIPMKIAAYGSSKAALNFVTRKIHIENEGIIAFPINPGWVQTDMGAMGAKEAGIESPPTTLEDSVAGLIDKIDNATREETSGAFESWDGIRFAW